MKMVIDPEWMVILYDILFNSGSKGFEIALVVTGMKPGDWIDNWVNNREFVITKLKQLMELGAHIELLAISDYLTEEEAGNLSVGHNHIYFHHVGIPKDAFEGLVDCLSKKVNLSRSTGIYFGYPRCCIDLYEKDCDACTDQNPFTEHRWCSPNCIQSIELQSLYRRTLMELFPWMPETGYGFSVSELRASYRTWRDSQPKDEFLAKIDQMLEKEPLKPCISGITGSYGSDFENILKKLKDLILGLEKKRDELDNHSHSSDNSNN